LKVDGSVWTAVNNSVSATASLDTVFGNPWANAILELSKLPQAVGVVEKQILKKAKEAGNLLVFQHIYETAGSSDPCLTFCVGCLEGLWKGVGLLKVDEAAETSEDGSMVLD